MKWRYHYPPNIKMPASYASRRRNVARTLRQLRPPTKFTPPPSYESEGTPALRPAHMGSRQITPPPTYVEQETPTRLPADTERESASPPPNYIESARTPCRHVDFSSPAPQQEPLPLFLGRNGNEIEALLPHSMLQAANWQPHSRHLLPPYDHNGTEPQWGNDSNRRAGPIHELDYRAEQSYESFEEPPSSDSDVSEYQPDPLARGKYKRVRRGSEHAGGLAYGTQIFRFPPLQEPPVSTRSPAHAGSGDSSQTETDEGTTTRVRRGRRKLVLKSKRPGKRKVENKIILAENVKPEELRKLQSDCEDLFDRIPQSIGQCSAWEDELIGIAKLIPGKPGSLVNTTQEEVLKYVFKSITRYPDNVWISIIAIQINRRVIRHVNLVSVDH
ncbi:hypothetical protein AX16_006775 [Volvariella volvacea WC 439]|nr:hypothetical protein AX16_006775 [Volvariella volvacea WC 439]